VVDASGEDEPARIYYRYENNWKERALGTWMSSLIDGLIGLLFY
jgi:hypothetical protein